MPTLASSERALQQWLRELHFFLPLTRSDAYITGHGANSSLASVPSSAKSLWKFYVDIRDIPRSKGMSPSPLHRSRPNSEEIRSRPALTELPSGAVESHIVEELRELYPRLALDALPLPNDWKHPHINLRLANKSRYDLNHDALLVYLEQGTEDAHYKWEESAYFDDLKEGEANIMIMEDRTTNDGQIGGKWWLLHVASYPALHQISDAWETDRFMASCMSGLFTAPDFESPDASRLNHPLSFAPLDNVAPVSIMAQMQFKGWEEYLFPIGFAAQRGKLDAPNLLARTLQATLNLLILYFLSTRASVDEVLPHWLYIYGITYDQDGLVIFVHFPHLVEIPASNPTTGQPTQRYWGYISVMICDDYSENFKGRDASNLNLANALLVIRAHTMFLMEKLEQWSEYKDMNFLIEYAKRRKRRESRVQ